MKVERLNLAIQLVSHYVLNCRYLNLCKYTLISADQQRRRPVDTLPLDLETYDGYSLDTTKYHRFKDSGWVLSDQANRHMRESIKKTLYEHGVHPDNSSLDLLEPYRIPRMIIDGRDIELYPPIPMDETNLGDVIKMRAQARTKAVRSKPIPPTTAQY